MGKESRNPQLNILAVIRMFFSGKFKKRERYIDVQIPKNFMNCGITICNKFTADTNDSKNWDTLKFPLPKPKNKWEIKSYWGDINKPEIKYVKLVDRFWF
jgi:hypothetical protein